MKKTLIMATGAALVFIAFLGIVSGEEGQFSKSDPSGDYYELMGTLDVSSNIDIIEIAADYSSFPATVSLKVDGEIKMGAFTDYSYTYEINLDTSDDGEADILVQYMSLVNVIIITWDGGTDTIDSSNFTIVNGDTMKVELTESSFQTSTVFDMGAMAVVTDLSNYKSATDELEMDGVSDDDDDTSDDDDVMDDDDNDYDPATETPTDNSISVEIKDVSFNYDVTEEHMSIEIKISGKTTGDVHHCSNLMATYDKNGDPEDMEDDEWEDGPDGTDRMTFMGYTMEQYFKGTGDDGENDWSEWEFYVYMDGPFDENMSMFEEDELDDDKTLVFFVRAYSDEAETMWNQDSRDVTDKVLDAINGGGGDDSPMGPAVILLGFISAAGIAMMFSRRKN